MRTPKLSGRWRLVVAFLVFAMVAAACSSNTSETTTTTTAAPATTTTAGGGGTTTTTAAPVADFVYQTGIFSDTSTDNFWAYVDPNSTVWNAYVLAPTKPALFGIQLPGLELTNDVASSADPGVASADGDGFSITVPMRMDAMWSDGEPITAQDVVFTAETVRDLGLGGGWVDSYQWAPEDNSTLGLTAVEAIDDHTVKFTWNKLPGLAIWPFGPGLGAIMPSHFWQSTVDEAKTSADPAEVLYGASGIGDPSGGPTIFDSREPGAFTKTVANTTYYDKGREVTSGGVTYPTGPFISAQVYSVYGDQSAGVLALKAGDVDYLYNPLGLQRGLQSQIIGDENLTSVVNPTNGFRYMAFNMRRDPMARQEFRDAVAYMTDKEYVANSVLQGVAFPLYATVPEGNVNWYDATKADAYQATYLDASTDVRGYDGMPLADRGDDGILGTADDGDPYTATGTEARFQLAVATLVSGGFSWPAGMEPDYANAAVVPGHSVMLDGTPVQALKIEAPGPGYDPLRATYSLILAQELKDLGFDATAFPTDFNVLVNDVFVPNDAGELDYDMFLLGWSLGNPAFPTYHESFFAGKNDTLINDGNNNTGFNDPDFNALVEEYNAATTIADAKDIMWQMEDILFAKKPYIVLFDTGILEAYRSASIAFPFTDTLGGLQFGNGFSGVVASK